MVFRTTKGDDERQLRENNSKVKVLSILKVFTQIYEYRINQSVLLLINMMYTLVILQNGLQFTTPQLESISMRYKEVDMEYAEKQQSVVTSAMETALSYLPLVEAVSDLLAELDVLAAFATAAAAAPREYVRPVILPKGSGVMQLKVRIKYDDDDRMFSLHYI
jgi:DNA mismatch repair ATPase MutS